MNNFFSFFKNKFQENLNRKRQEEMQFQEMRKQHLFQQRLDREAEIRQRTDEKFQELMLKQAREGSPRERRIAIARLNAMENRPLDPSTPLGKFQQFTRRNIVKKANNLERVKQMRNIERY